MDSQHGNGATGSVTGELVFVQVPGSGDFHAGGEWDSNGDGVRDGQLDCNGVVGQGKFAMDCQGTDDDGGEVAIMLLGKASMARSGKILLRKTQGSGFLSWGSLKLVFAADSQ